VSALYDIILADCPWPYYGDPNKDAAAGKHYALLSLGEIAAIPVASMASPSAALFMWATCPRLPDALETMKAWGWYFRSVAFIWVKTRRDGAIIHGQGVQPTFTKPTTELLLAGTRKKTGRAFPLLDHAMGQVVLAPRGAHSAKPPIFREKIVQLLGDRPRLELFAREHTAGWDAHGLDLDGTRWGTP
jgi:N6-adenosine-specific RNA methylase IME4